MKKILQAAFWFGRIILGCTIFAIAFNLFLGPNDLNAGGISGLAMVLVKVLGIGSVGLVTVLMNLPLFILGGIKIGKKFFVGSVAGLASLSVMLDVMAVLPKPDVDPLLAALYGGVIGGLGLGLVYSTGGSTGGSDIIVRLLKRKVPNMPIGTLNIMFDLTVALLTGLAFGDMSRSLYCGVAIFICGQVVDAVVYRFDYSKVALIISKEPEKIAKTIGDELEKGATFLHGEGSYSGEDKKVILTVVKRHQLAELKRLVVQIDPKAFIIVQEAHQVLGDGFARYSKDSL